MSDHVLIENGTVVTAGESMAVLPAHSILIEHGRIARIAPKHRFKAFRGKRIDASHKVILPGLINAHTHLYSTFARGLTRTKPASDFSGVLKNLWWRLDSALTTEDCYYSALIPLLECIRHGTTMIIDHHASPNAITGSLDAIARAVHETGLRACLCYEVSDRDGSRVAHRGLEENISFIRHCQKLRARSNGDPKHAQNTEHGILTTEHSPRTHASAPVCDPHLAALFGLHASFTLKQPTLEKAATLGHQLGAGFHIHVAEAASDQAHARRHFRTSAVGRLHKAGILGPRTLAAHCVHITPPERALLAETGTAVIHNPQSNLNNAVGVADIVALAKAGAQVGLGTDAMTTNMFEEVRAALWAQHFFAQNPAVGFAEATTSLFQNNPKIASRIFNLPLGELREGAAADVIVVDYDPPTPLDAHNGYGHLLFGLSQAAVDSTIVGGRILMQNKRLTLNLDEARIYARARERAAQLWKRM